jgi:hypothetical protein
MLRWRLSSIMSVWSPDFPRQKSDPRVDNAETLAVEARGIFPESYASKELLEYNVPARKVAHDQDGADSA